MMQMYFLTQENQVGMLTGSTGNWSYKMIDGADQQQQVTYLFESLQKQVRTGLFPLPTQANQ